MTTLTDTQVITASGGLVELGYANLTANATITAAVASPALVTGLSTTVVCDGSPVMVEFFTPSLRPPVTAGQEIVVNLFVDGSSYGFIANAYNPASNNDNKPAHGCYRLTPTAGSHTFDIRAGVTSGATGFINSGNNSGGAAAFIRVSKIVQATQWPAVTTGTIICTSSTRPSAPFVGQKIYETDTKKELTYDGASWTQPWNQPWGLMGIGTHDTGAGVSTGVSICSVTFTAVAGRMYLASYVSRTLWSGGAATVGIYDNNTGLRIAEDYGAPSPVVLQRAKTFSAGSRTLSIRQDGATTMTPISGSYSGNERPAQLVVRDIGPA